MGIIQAVHPTTPTILYTMQDQKQLPQDLFTEGLTNDPPVPYVASIAGRNYLVDHEANRIAFFDSRFYRCEDGSMVPSVTTILKAYPNGAQYYEWLKKHGQDADEIRDEAGRRGSVVHEATEILDLGGRLELMNADGSPKYKLLEWAMTTRYVEFRNRFPATIQAIETKLADAGLGYAGTLDRLMTIGDATYLVDIKTSGGIWPSYWLQQAAYHRLLHETGLAERLFPDGVPEIKLAILWLNAKTRGEGRKGAIQGAGWQFVVQPESTEHYLHLFDCTRALWMAENAGVLPKQTEYELTLSIEPTGVEGGL